MDWEETVTVVMDECLERSTADATDNNVDPFAGGYLGAASDGTGTPGAGSDGSLRAGSDKNSGAGSVETERVGGDEDPGACGHKTVEGNQQEVLDALKEAFGELTSVKNLQDMVELHSKLRVIVSVDKLLELVGEKCTHNLNGQLCGCPVSLSAHPNGSWVEIRWVCEKGHHGRWQSSEVLARNRNNVYLNDCMIAIAVVISGNNYGKFQLLCKALNLGIIGKTTFLAFQKNCALPVIDDVWVKMKKIIVEIIGKYEEPCVCGDGRNDSPGHCARYCVYTIMEHVTKVVVDVEVLDKRETSGNSPVMEKEALRRLLERLMGQLKLCELTTDASSTIMKLIRDMKGKFQWPHSYLELTSGVLDK